MKTLITMLILLLATTAQAGESKIVETETGLIAEITGSPASSSIDNATRLKDLTARIEQLKKERADILKLKGNETEDELMQKNALADEKKLQIESYSAEISQLTANDQNMAAGTEQPKAEQPERYQSYRQEKKNQIMELKKMRMNPPAAVAPQ